MITSIRTLAVGAGIAVALALSAGLSRAQEPTTARPSKVVAPPAKRANDTTRRVPDYFGQIGLTPEQREEIYKIRGKHQARIDELERQIVEVQSEMLAECEGVLSDSQKQLLMHRRNAAGAGKKAQEPVKDRVRSGE